MNNGNLKYRHFHWQILGQVGNGSMGFQVVADSFEEGVAICKTIHDCPEYIPQGVSECFAPHDNDEQSENFRKIMLEIIERLGKLEGKIS